MASAGSDDDDTLLAPILSTSMAEADGDADDDADADAAWQLHKIKAPRREGIAVQHQSLQENGGRHWATDEERENEALRAVIAGCIGTPGAQDPEQPGAATDRQSEEITQLPKKKKRRGAARKGLTGDQRRNWAWGLLEAAEAAASGTSSTAQGRTPKARTSST